MLERELFRLEPARRESSEDALVIVTWRNDPHTLAMFYHHTPKNPVDFEDEYRASYFSDDELLPQFVLRGDERVGFLRFGRIPDPTGQSLRCCDISINVAPAHRGRGIGEAALRLARTFLRKLDFDDVYAEVRLENGPSLRVFEKAGYELQERTEKLIGDTGERAKIARYRLRLK